jgi:uncharacterized protein YeeX (DUF496 family)
MIFYEFIFENRVIKMLIKNSGVSTKERTLSKIFKKCKTIFVAAKSAMSVRRRP